MRRDRLFFFTLLVLAVISLGYGMATLPEYWEEKKDELDHIQIVQIAQIQESLNRYYNIHRELPERLDALSDVDITDPQTGKPYAYKITKITDVYFYELCATFSTDNRTLSEAEDVDPNYPEYSNYALFFKHPKGYYCFEANTVWLQPRENIGINQTVTIVPPEGWKEITSPDAINRDVRTFEPNNVDKNNYVSLSISVNNNVDKLTTKELFGEQHGNDALPESMIIGNKEGAIQPLQWGGMHWRYIISNDTYYWEIIFGCDDTCSDQELQARDTFLSSLIFQ